MWGTSVSRRVILSTAATFNRRGGELGQRNDVRSNVIKKHSAQCCRLRCSYQTKSDTQSNETTPMKRKIKIQHVQSFTLPPGSDPNIDHTGLSVWGSAEPLLDYLCNKYFIPGHHMKKAKGHTSNSPLRILELGSGCGKVGIGLACAVEASKGSGGVKVVLTDHLEMIPHLQRNIDLNRHMLDMDQILVHPLTWGSKEDMSNLEKKIHDYESKWDDHVDNKDGDNSLFDLIVGSDLLYNPNSHMNLIQTIQRFATPGHTQIYLGYPSHRNKTSSEQIFLEEVCQPYFDVTIEPLQQIQCSSGSANDDFGNNNTTTAKSMVAILQPKP